MKDCQGTLRRYCAAIAFLLLCIALPFARAEGQPVFAEETHTSTLEYLQYFKVQAAHEPLFSLSMEDAIFTPEAGEALLAKIGEDMAAIAQLRGGAPSMPSIFVVKKPVNGSMQRVEERIYCTAEDVFSGAYHLYLTQAALTLDDLGLSTGVSAYLLGRQADNEKLRAYYEAAENLDILSLHPAYFIDDFTDESIRALAAETSLSRAAFVIETEGLASLLDEERQEALTEGWLRSIGLDRKYEDPYEEALSGYTFFVSQNEKKHPLSARTAEGDIFHFQRIEHHLESPIDIKTALLEMELERTRMLAIIEAEAPDFLEEIRERSMVPITCYFDSTVTYCHTYPSVGRMHLMYPADYGHELAHLLILPYYSTYYNDFWKYEGIARYLSFRSVCAEAYLQEHIDTIAHFEDVLVELEQWQVEHLANVRDLYLSHREMPTSTEDIDIEMYYQVYVEAGILCPVEGMPHESLQSFYKAYQISLKSEGGNELSSLEAFSLTRFLIREYSLSTFLSYCQNPNILFDDIFGIPYAEAKEQWLTSIRNEVVKVTDGGDSL